MYDKLRIIGGILLLAATLVGAFYAAQYILELWASADKSVQTALIAGAFALASILFTYWKERQRAINEAHREKKIDVYSDFYDVIFYVLEESKSASGSVEIESNKKLMDKLQATKRGAMFYGSPKVLHSLSQFMLTSPETKDETATLKAVGRILLAMREDIGLGNKGLNELTVLQVLITDDLSKYKKAEHSAI